MSQKRSPGVLETHSWRSSPVSHGEIRSGKLAKGGEHALVLFSKTPLHRPSKPSRKEASPKFSSIILWKGDEAFIRPNGIILNLKVPNLHTNAIFSSIIVAHTVLPVFLKEVKRGKMYSTRKLIKNLFDVS